MVKANVVKVEDYFEKYDTDQEDTSTKDGTEGCPRLGGPDLLQHLARIIFRDDYRDPEPPPLFEDNLKKLLFPKVQNLDDELQEELEQEDGLESPSKSCTKNLALKNQLILAKVTDWCKMYQSDVAHNLQEHKKKKKKKKPSEDKKKGECDKEKQTGSLTSMMNEQLLKKVAGWCRLYGTDLAHNLQYAIATRRAIYQRSLAKAREPRFRRRVLEPASKYLVAEMEEDGFEMAARTLHRFIETDDKHVENNHLRRRPLRHQLHRLVFLSEVLKVIESYIIYGYKRVFICSLCLQLGYFLEEMNRADPVQWRWLPLEMYRMARQAITGYRGDDGYREALARYMLANYNYNLLGRAEDALEDTRVTVAICKGKEWTLEPLTGCSTSLYDLGVNLFYAVCFTQAEECLAKHPQDRDRAIQLRLLALKAVKDNGRHPGVESAMRSLAGLWVELGWLELALDLLKHQTKESHHRGDRHGLVAGLIFQALCYKKMELYELCYQSLMKAERLAVQLRVPHYEGLACMALGEYHAIKNEFQTADQYLSRALERFQEIDNEEWREVAVKNAVHAGAVKAAIHLPTYKKAVDMLAEDWWGVIFGLLKWELTEEESAWAELAEAVTTARQTIRAKKSSTSVTSVETVRPPRPQSRTPSRPPRLTHESLKELASAAISVHKLPRKSCPLSPSVSSDYSASDWSVSIGSVPSLRSSKSSIGVRSVNDRTPQPSKRKKAVAQGEDRLAVVPPCEHPRLINSCLTREQKREIEEAAKDK